MALAKKRKIFDNRYEILSIVGRGSASVVYHARHLGGTQADVALKVLVSSEGERSTAEQLRKEALAMVSARHKYVIRLDDFHSVGELSYLAMEYAPESDLRRYIQSIGGKLGPIQGQLFLIQAAEGLNFIHQAGIVHRDIKPDNILVINDREIRLADFGVAVLPGEKSSLEELQKGVGTMSYMAPEVLEGTTYDSKSDIYALGVTFYELLSGIHPFENVPLMQQLEVRKDGAFPNISSLVPALPPALAAAIMQAMSYEPADRFSTARELVQTLLNAHVTTAKREPRPEARKEIKLRRGADDGGGKAADQQPDAAKKADQPQPAQAEHPAKAEDKTVPMRPREDKRAELRRRSEKPTSRDNLRKEQREPERKAEEAAPRGIHRVEQHQAEDMSVAETVAIKRSDVEKARGIARGIEKDPAPAPSEDANPQVEPAKEIEGTDEHPSAAIEAIVQAVKSEPAPVAPQPARPKPERKLEIPRIPRSSSYDPRKSRYMVASIVLFFAILAFVVNPQLRKIAGKLASRITGAQVAESVESPIPAYSGEALAFPEVPGGLFLGTISGFMPGKELPFNIISFPERRQLAVIIGVEGWTPLLVDIPEDSDTLRIKSNGLILDITGQSEDGALIGYFSNVISGDQGEWFVKPAA